MFGANYTPETAGGQIVILFASILSVAIFVRALLSWFNLDPRSPIVQALDSITEPIIAPIRQVMPRLGMFDLSPLVAILLLNVGGAVIASIVDDFIQG